MTSDGVNYTQHFEFDWSVGTDNSVIIGAHFQGKTHLAKHLVAKPLLGKYPLWIWDHHGKFTDLTDLSNVVRSVSGLRYGLQVLKPIEKSPGAFFQFCALVNKQSDLHVIIDETHNFCSAHKIAPEFATLVRDKGNNNVSYTCVFQRPAEVHKSIISNALHRFVFAFDVPTDVIYLKQWIGTEVELFLPPQLRRHHREEPQLPPRSFIYRNMQSLKPVVVVGGLKSRR